MAYGPDSTKPLPDLALVSSWIVANISESSILSH